MNVSTKEILEDIRSALQPIGNGLCDQCGCEGCKYEVGDAIATLRILVAKIEGWACLACGGNRWIYDDKYKSGIGLIPLCSDCGGTGLAREWTDEDLFRQEK